MLKEQRDQEQVPVCFGQHFSQTAKECMGGFDPNWVDPEGRTGHIRERCIYVNSCSSRTQASKGQSSLIPVNSLVRSVPHTQFSGPSTYAKPNPTPAPVNVNTRPWAPPMPYGPPQSFVHQQPMMQQMMPVNFAIPQFLSVRESNGNIFKRLGWEVFRSVGKAIGHTIAHAFDSEAFGHRNVEPPPPEGTEGQ